MNLLLDRILVAATPLVLAAAKGKPKPLKKKTVRRTPPARAPKVRPHAKKSARRAKPATRRVARGKSLPVHARKMPPPPTAPAVAPKPEPAPPPKPVPPIGRAILLSPENEKYVDSFHPTFRWLSVGGATRYEIAWSEESGLTTHHTIFSIATEATVPVEEPLHLGETYFWRVRGGNESGWSAWSDIFSFRVLEETP